MIRQRDAGDGSFVDREEAGERLAAAVALAGPYERPVVLALPRGGLPVARPVAESLVGRSVILVDDGLATGSTMSAAVETVRRSDAREVVVAVPVAPRDTCDRLRGEADRVICLVTPGVFYAVGEWYRDFREIGDAEVVEILDAVERARTAGQSG